MSKISQYLNEHLLGDVSTEDAVCKYFANDASLLSIKPEIVAYPRSTNDIRKIARFTYQLATKGHAISITARGAGSDRTGAAIGDGIVVNTKSHMGRIFEFDTKQRLVRAQPGVTVRELNSALRLQGYYIPSFPESVPYSTIGGAIANNSSGRMSGKYGATEDYVHELEVVLATGDVLQTSRLNKRELNKKKGLQTFEGDIYRAIDNLIEDNKDLIDDKLGDGAMDNSGYASIAKVKQKNGSFDLTPLFIGSQGTLGIVSELILKTEFYNDNESMLVAVVGDDNKFRDIVDEYRKLDPDFLDIYSGDLIERAKLRGKSFPICKEATQNGDAIAGIVVCGFVEFADRVRARKVKKADKIAAKYDATTLVAHNDSAALDQARSLSSIVYSARQPQDGHDTVTSDLFTGVYIPDDRFEDFCEDIDKLGKKHSSSLPVSGHATDSVYSFWPEISLKNVAGKQRLLRLYDEFAKIVDKHAGTLVAESGEGRVKAPFIDKYTDTDIQMLYEQVRKAFDPEGTLNRGVKTPLELREVVKSLRSATDTARFADYSSES